MAGIGDYIHYFPYNYRLYGINQRSGNNNFGKVLDDQHAHLKSLAQDNWGDNANIDKITKYFESIWYGEKLFEKINIESDSEIENKTYQTLMQTITDIINNSEDPSDNAGSSNWTSEQVKKSLSEPSNALIKNSGVTSKELKSALQVKTIKKMIESLENAYKNTNKLAERMNGKITLREAELSQQELQNQINSLIRKLNQVVKNLPDKKMINFDNVKYSQPKIGNLKDVDIPNFKELLLYVQEILRLYQGSGVYLIAGPTSEVSSAVAVAFDNAKLTETEIYTDEIIKNALKMRKGNDSIVQNYGKDSGFFLHASYFVENLNKTNSFGTTTIDGDDYHLIYTPKNKGGGKGTIDVSLTPFANTELGEIVGSTEQMARTINASLKSYSNPLSNGISLVDSTPLTSLLLTNFFITDFVNHYANLAGAYPYENSSDYKESKETIKWGAALRGFSGFYGNNEFLIINDRGKKRVYGITANKFNTLLEKNYGNLDSILSVKASPPVNSRPINIWEPGTGVLPMRTRISNLFLKINETKLKVTLKGQGIKQF